MLEKIMCVYAIKCKIDKKVYVGVTKNLRHRWHRHISYLRAGTHWNKYLQKGFNRYGENNFEIIILVNLESISLEQEKYWIHHYTNKNCSYNYTQEEKNILQKWSWKDKPESKAQMIKSLKIAKRKYDFHQYTKTGDFIKTWNSVDDIVKENSNYKWQNIYSVCNGYKKTYMGFVWTKTLKI